MFTLFGKFKNKDWEELDNAHTKDDILTLQDIHKDEKGQGWMFAVKEYQD